MFVRVENLTQKTTIMRNGKIADNPWTRLKGLIGTKQLDPGEGLLIKPCKGVHCMFMSIPIDVLYVNDSDQVVGIDERMLPNCIGKPRRECSYVLEVPAGTIALSKTNSGDLIQVIYQESEVQSTQDVVKH